MNRPARPNDAMNGIQRWRRWACRGLVTVALTLLPWPGHAEESRIHGGQFALGDSTPGSSGSPAARSTVASLSPGSVLIAQAGVSPADPSGSAWQFSIAPWRYMHVDIEKGSGASTLDADVSFNGPFLGFNFYF